MSTRPDEYPVGTCDWGDCDYIAREWREDPETGVWLPVCNPHSEQGERFLGLLHSTYRNTKGSFA